MGGLAVTGLEDPTLSSSSVEWDCGSWICIPLRRFHFKKEREEEVLIPSVKAPLGFLPAQHRSAFAPQPPWPHRQLLG